MDVINTHTHTPLPLHCSGPVIVCLSFYRSANITFCLYDIIKMRFSILQHPPNGTKTALKVLLCDRRLSEKINIDII